MSIRSLIVIFFCIASSALAAGVPQRKSGLWEIKTRSDGAPEMTMQMCIDARQDDLAAQSSGDARKRCPKVDSRHVGATLVVDSVCNLDRTTARSHTEVSGNLASDYRMETTTRFEPPLYGMAKSHSVMTGRWLGPCKPGQSHGTTVLSGMPAGGQIKLNPEMMKQMEKMMPPSNR